jgi:poly-gamma-glutamate capsule biosynthesis protein CapA/YwtB (metallophosphatase superfamily)
MNEQAIETVASEPPAEQGRSGIRFIAVGDIMFDVNIPPPRIFFYQPEFAVAVPMDVNFRPSLPLVYVNNAETRKWLLQRGIPMEGITSSSHRYQSLFLPPTSENAHPNYPFDKIRSLLQASDFVFCNLECPLAARGRPTKLDGYYRASTQYAAAMAAANISVVSVSNNHCMDFGDIALADTVHVLRENGMIAIGAVIAGHQQINPIGMINVKGIRLAFLAYNMIGPELSFAMPGETGICPLNELALKQDLLKIRDEVDYVIASVHWGTEGKSRPCNQMISLAHQLIDEGVDLVLGHHPHVPGAVELYQGKVIFYSLGNFIFGHTHTHWRDNIIAQFTVSHSGVEQIEIIPIGTSGAEQFQPRIIESERAEVLLTALQELSRNRGTTLTIGNSRAVVEMKASAQPLAMSTIYQPL